MALFLFFKFLINSLKSFMHDFFGFEILICSLILSNSFYKIISKNYYLS